MGCRACSAPTRGMGRSGSRHRAQKLLVKKKIYTGQQFTAVVCSDRVVCVMAAVCAARVCVRVCMCVCVYMRESESGKAN